MASRAEIPGGRKGDVVVDTLLVVVMVAALALGVSLLLFAGRLLRHGRGAGAQAAGHSAPEASPAWDGYDVGDDLDDLTYQAPSLYGAVAAGPVPVRVRWTTLVLLVLAFMAAGAGAVYGLYGRDVRIAWPPPAFAAAGEPLELLSLAHRRDADGSFVVTGVVQNPAAGRAAPNLVAVAYLFDADGQYVASGRAALDSPALAPGSQSTFSVRLPGMGAVSRYRLGFRLRDGGVVNHVDRRAE